MSFPYLSVPIFSFPNAPGGQLFTYFAGGTVFAPTYAASGAINTNPVILDANGQAAVRRDPDISYHFVLTDSTGQTTLWDADNFPADQIFGTATTLAAQATVDVGSSPSHSVLVHGAGATIASFGTSANPGTPFYFVQFDGVNTLVNSSTLVLPGGQNITTSANDAAIAQFTGIGWNVLFYQQGFVSGNALPVDLCLYKSAATNVTSNATLFQDTDLSTTTSLPIGTYEFELLVILASNNGTNGGFKFNLKVPSANGVTPACAQISNVNNTFGSSQISFTASSVNIASGSYATLSNNTGATHTTDWIWVRGTFAIAGAASPVQLWWSQNTSSSALTGVAVGSMLKVRSAISN